MHSEWFKEWADKCKVHNFTLVEPKLRKAADAFDVLGQIIKAHEDVDSGADIPVHIYKQAKAALARTK